jgi:hypothetical protein
LSGLTTQRNILNADIVAENNYGESEEEDIEELELNNQRSRAKSIDPVARKNGQYLNAPQITKKANLPSTISVQSAIQHLKS